MWRIPTKGSDPKVVESVENLAFSGMDSPKCIVTTYLNKYKATVCREQNVRPPL